MEPDRRSRLSPEERRAQLVALGVAALVDQPLESLTIEQLSQRAGVSRGLLFHYFGSKQGLHREVVRTARDSMLRATEPAVDLPPIERLRDTLTRIVHFVRDHRGTFYSLVRGAASGSPEVREVVEQARLAQAERLMEVFRELGARDSELLRIGLIAHAHADPHLAVTNAVQLRSGDVALAITHSGNTVDVIEPLRVAFDRGATTIAITGRPEATAAQYADHVLTTATSRESELRPAAMSSRTSQLLVVDCLFVGVAQRTYERAAPALAASYEALAHRHSPRPRVTRP